MGWRMPHEGHEHERTWLAWPTTGYTLGESAGDAEEARTTWAAVANATAEFEPVTVLVDERDVDVVGKYLSSEIAVEVTALDDAWVRDTGPTFVLSDGADGPVRLGAVNWVFNGWGGQDWASWENDRHVGSTIAELAGAELIDSPLVNEGGGIHVDGEGTVLATRSVQLDPGRNPDWTAADVESEFAGVLGTTTVLWLPRGLYRDSQRFGTRGHVDIVATFANPGTVLVHAQDDASHPDSAIMADIEAVLARSTDARGRTPELVRLPAPGVLRDDEGWVDYSYVNHLIVNGGVIACSFGDRAADERAVAVLSEVYPGRTVRTVDARPLFARGGGIHCITQHEPTTR